MTVNLNIHLKKDDSITASVLEAEEDGDFISLKIEDSSIYFEGYGLEGYKNACRILDRMKNAVQEAWLEEYRPREADHEKEKVQTG